MLRYFPAGTFLAWAGGGAFAASLVWSLIAIPVMAIRGEFDHVGPLSWVVGGFLVAVGVGVGFGLRVALEEAEKTRKLVEGIARFAEEQQIAGKF